MTDHNDIGKRIQKYLDEIEAHLNQPRSQKSEVLQNVEAHIRDALARRSEENPNLDDLEAVIAEMDAPESYGERPPAKQLGSVMKPLIYVAVVLTAILGVWLVSTVRKGSTTNDSPPLAGCAADGQTSVQDTSPPASEKKYSADDIRLHDMDFFFQKLGERGSEYHYYAAMWALATKCKIEPEKRDDILTRACRLFDTSTNTNVRIQCIGIVSDAGAKDYADFMIEALHNDRSEQIRGFAAHSLLFFKDKTLIAELKDALKTERSESVIHSIQATIDRLSQYPD